MNHKFFSDLKQSSPTWSPEKADLETMLSKAHQRAKSIRSLRRRGLCLALTTLGVGLFSVLMPPTPDTPSEKNQPIAIVDQPQSTSNTLSATKTVYSKEERQLMLAVAEANSFHSDDFDFISEALTSPWSELLSSQ